MTWKKTNRAPLGNLSIEDDHEHDDVDAQMTWRRRREKERAGAKNNNIFVFQFATFEMVPEQRCRPLRFFDVDKCSRATDINLFTIQGLNEVIVMSSTDFHAIRRNAK